MSYESTPRPALTADTVVFAGPGDDRHVLLVERGRPPFVGSWALPGGFLEEGEVPEGAARRELAEETSFQVSVPLVLVGVYGERGRDPRGWTVSIAYAADAGRTRPEVRGGDDASGAAWHPIAALPHLAFDHDRILADARMRLGI
jgi:8-oxo-dGTP diphosphatase